MKAIGTIWTYENHAPLKTVWVAELTSGSLTVSVESSTNLKTAINGANKYAKKLGLVMDKPWQNGTVHRSGSRRAGIPGVVGFSG